MTRNCHRVQRQVIDLAIGRGAEGAAVQGQLARPFWDRALPELEAVFDRVAGPNERLRLERLEIDLGRIEGADWPAEFRRRLVAELARSLPGADGAPAAIDRQMTRDHQPARAWEPFLFFLSHGRLPWWSPAPGERWADEAFEEADTSGWQALRNVLAADRRAGVRLVHAVPDAFLDGAVRQWSGMRHTSRVFERLTPAPLRGDARHRWRRGFWMIVLEGVLAGAFRSSQDGQELLRAVLALRDSFLRDREQPAPSQRLPSPATESGPPSRSAPGEDLPDPWGQWYVALANADVVTDRAPRASRVDRPADDVPAPTRHRQDTPRDRDRQSLDEDAVYCGGAGAVLLHPFLEPLFRERGLLDGRAFRDDEARQRAVHLLGLLTFGRDDHPEHELLLPKLLCGVPFDEPLEPACLEDDDMAACDGLLHAVLAHWTALRSNSPEWLRQQFFLRDGKLEQVDGGYRLTVERRAQDVLLGRLPWGFGAIALPWLPDRIFVRWLE